jgi:hypothetical protein
MPSLTLWCSAGHREHVKNRAAVRAAGLRTSQALVVPSAAECFEQIDLNLDLAGIGRGDRRVHRSFDIAHDGYVAGSVSNLDLLTTEQSLVALDLALRISECLPTVERCAVFS